MIVAGQFPGAAAAAAAELPPGLCINVTGTSLLDPAARARTIEALRSAGVNTVRVPLRVDSHNRQGDTDGVDPAYLAAIRTVARELTGAGLSVILDVHDFKRLRTNPDAERGRFARFWRDASAAWKSLPPNVWFEILNEPNRRIDRTNFPRIAAAAVSAIRANDATRTIVIGGVWQSHYKSLGATPLPDDARIVPTFHYYDPMAFTHQGAGWRRGPKRRVALDDTNHAERLERAVAFVRDYAAVSGKRPFIGEYGVTVSASRDDRIRYIRGVSRSFARIGVNACIWAWDSKPHAFAISRNGTIDPDLLAAMRPN